MANYQKQLTKSEHMLKKICFPIFIYQQKKMNRHSNFKTIHRKYLINLSKICLSLTLKYVINVWHVQHHFVSYLSMFCKRVLNHSPSFRLYISPDSMPIRIDNMTALLTMSQIQREKKQMLVPRFHSKLEFCLCRLFLDSSI